MAEAQEEEEEEEEAAATQAAGRSGSAARMASVGRARPTFQSDAARRPVACYAQSHPRHLMTIALIRHAETDLNAARVLQWPDTPLGERGRAQARALGARFADTRPAAILSSDMMRARQTADAIAAATGVPVLESPLLGERNFGVLRGRRYDELEHDPIHDEHGAPQGESMTEFRDRVASALDWVRMIRRQAGGDVLTVTHGLVIRLLLAEHCAWPDAATPPESLANTSVSILLPAPPHRVILCNCSRHLDAPIADDGRGVAGI
jgi:broad specificity phosphatase PhoE